ncbi:MAG: GIY-YIG nuclease family protein [Bacteroidales bacterium]|nr:GIY-YIG nuclease family protein [Bacteroidales bacterium]
MQKKEKTQNEENNKPGYVYILTNPSFREDWVKIGKSSRPVDVRSKELDNTAVPLPFEIYATMQTVKYAEIEKIIHKQIDRLTDLRIRQNREFFNVDPAQALDILLDLAVAFDDAIIMKYDGGKPYQLFPAIENTKKIQQEEKKLQRPPFNFNMVGLTVGDTIIFDALKLPVTVAGKNKVEYEGRLWSLSAFCGTFLPDNMHNPSESYQGPKYFSYKGKTLWELRLEREKCGR